MTLRPAWLRRLRARFKYRHFHRDLSREIEAHRAMAEDDLTSSGLAPGEARARTSRTLGNVTLAREDSRAVWIARWMETLAQDGRYALRGLRRSPGVTLAALLVLVAAMGLNASLFSGFNAVLLREWPLPDASRIASVFAARGSADVVYGGWPVAEITYLQQHATTIDLVGMRDEQVAFGDQPDGQTRFVRIATSNYFSTLGVGIQIGRGFEAGDDVREAPRAVVVLSDHIWRDEYAADPALVGKAIALNRMPFLVIGIANPGAMDSPLDRMPSAWLPFAALTFINGDAQARSVLTDPASCCSDLAGRLRPSVTHAAANAEINGLSEQFRRDMTLPFKGVLVTGTALMDTPRAGTATPIFGLMSAGMLLILLLACANVGNLLLARGLARRTEVRVRLSLGASRGRLVRQFMTESLVLAAVAGACSLPIAMWLPARIVAGIDPALARSLNPTPDATVWLFVFIVMTMSSVAFGLVPALRATRGAARMVAAGHDSGDRGTVRLRLTLLAGQVAISALLLVSAGLLVRAVTRAALIDPGFALAAVSAASVTLPANSYAPDQQWPLERAVLEAMATGGAGQVAATSREPLAARGMTTRAARLPGQSESDSQRVELLEVSAEYFAVMRIPIIEGQPLSDAGPPEAVVITRSLAQRWWPGAQATGRRFITSAGEDYEVAGVVGDVRLSRLEAIEPTVFRRRGVVPATSVGAMTFVFPRDPAVEARLRAALSSVDGRVRVVVTPITAHADALLLPSRIGATLAAGVGLIAVAMAAIGVFGVFSFMVAARRREIGVRVALGASGFHIIRVVIGAAAWALAVGLGAGTAASLLIAPVLRQYLYGLSPVDPTALAAAALVLGAAAFLATVDPVRRALRVDPVATLKQE